ncbi:hypothetical protein in CLP 5'region [Xanthomonas oryzae pv. oryzae KACC 10331]|uniref:NAD-specific glutamate dehydrogenase n=1 Tax=Xanthomonas oryzae pv. oryzae (strain KACC10331 / KXO85) TaxID=291331 RepID=Q5GV63_XANOR|nr:hypothetical protein in CLP 5'region [Xanthomonas oryzae pv. oryzae KACC 10331]
MAGRPALWRWRACKQARNGLVLNLFAQVTPVKQFFDLTLEQRFDLHALLEREVLGALFEQVLIEVEVLQVHLRVEDIFLIDVDIDHLVARLHVLGEEVLDRIDLVVDVVLLPLHIAGKATDTVVHDHDVRFQRLDQIVQRLQRRDHATGCHIDVGTERGDAFLRVRFRICMDSDMTLVHVSNHGVGDQLPAGLLLVDHRFFGDQNRHRCTLRIVVLTCDIEDVGANDLGHIGQDLRQTISVVLLIDILDVALTLLFGTRITDVVDVEAQRLGEVVEPL